jgi:digeranylgeranylglycerophospholipid reductase
MKSGRMAAITADRCFTEADPDTSAEAMSVYSKLWHSEVAPRMRERLLMTELLYLTPNERYDTLMDDLRHTDGDTLAKVNAGNVRAMLRLLHLGDVGLLATFAKERLADR